MEQQRDSIDLKVIDPSFIFDLIETGAPPRPSDGEETSSSTLVDRKDETGG